MHSTDGALSKCVHVCVQVCVHTRTCTHQSMKPSQNKTGYSHRSLAVITAAHLEGSFGYGRTSEGEGRREMGKNICSKINTASC